MRKASAFVPWMIFTGPEDGSVVRRTSAWTATTAL